MADKLLCNCKKKVVSRYLLINLIVRDRFLELYWKLTCTSNEVSYTYIPTCICAYFSTRNLVSIWYVGMLQSSEAEITWRSIDRACCFVWAELRDVAAPRTAIITSATATYSVTTNHAYCSTLAIRFASFHPVHRTSGSYYNNMRYAMYHAFFDGHNMKISI